MDLLAHLPLTHTGRHTHWLWSWMLAFAESTSPATPDEVGEHFAPSVLELVSAEQILAHFAEVAPHLARVDRLVEEASSEHFYSALLERDDAWLRYTCLAQDEEPYLLVGATFSPAMDPSRYRDHVVRLDGRTVQVRDFGGTGPLLLLWHGAGADRTCWEPLVPFLDGFHVVAQDLPGHGMSPIPVFTIQDALSDADAVVAQLRQGPPLVLGHSLGGYLGLEYAAKRGCAGWIGLDGPFGLVYPWDPDDFEVGGAGRQIGREIRALDVAASCATIKCPALLLLSAIAENPLEEEMAPDRRELATYLSQHHPHIDFAWVQAGHDAMLFHQIEAIATRIRTFLDDHTNCL